MIDQIVLDSAEAVFDTLRLSNTSLFGDTVNSGWVFRGHGQADWRLVPSVWRDDFLPRCAPASEIFRKRAIEAAGQPIRADPWRGLNCTLYAHRLAEVIERLATEYQLLRSFVHLAGDLALMDLVGSWPDVGERISPDPSLLLDDPVGYHHAIAQHHGIPTRLLDWTSDPLTALFFAIEQSHTDSEYIVWGLDAAAYRDFIRRDTSNMRPRVQLVDANPRSNERLRSQRGSFTFILGGERAFVETSHYPSVDELVPPHMLRKFAVRLDDVNRIYTLRNLYREKRTRAHLMADLDACADVAKTSLRMNLYL